MMYKLALLLTLPLLFISPYRVSCDAFFSCQDEENIVVIESTSCCGGDEKSLETEQTPCCCGIEPLDLKQVNKTFFADLKPISFDHILNCDFRLMGDFSKKIIAFDESPNRDLFYVHHSLAIELYLPPVLANPCPLRI